MINLVVFTPTIIRILKDLFLKVKSISLALIGILIKKLINMKWVASPE